MTPNEPIRPLGEQDAVVSDALHQLPEPPPHRADFWNDLTIELGAQPTPERTNVTTLHQRFSSRAIGLMGAAAAVVLVGIATITILNRGNETVTTAAAPATSTTTTTEAATTTTTPTTAPPATTVEPIDPLLGTAVDDSWAVMGDTLDGTGQYIVRAVEEVDCGPKEFALQQGGVITTVYPSFQGQPVLIPGPQASLALYVSCQADFVSLSVGSEVSGPAPSFSPVDVQPAPLTLVDLTWDVQEKVLVGTAELTEASQPRPVRINSEGDLTIVDLSTAFNDRAESALFHYDAPVPDGFMVDFATGRGISETLLVDGEFLGGLEISNFFRGDVSWAERIESFSDDENAVDEKTIRIPLYENTDSGILDRGVVLDVQQTTFEGGFTENRIVRTYVFNDRTVTAQLTYRDGALGSISPEAILDDIRMYNAAFTPITSCSTDGATAPEAPPSLNPVQTARFEAIGTAVTSCDWVGLGAQLDPDGFTASFGGGEAIELWMDAEQYGEPILTTLLDHMGSTPWISEEGDAAWPAASAIPWAEVTDEMKQELLPLGYDESSFDFYTEFGGYIGWRTGINADGMWQYFVAGD